MSSVANRKYRQRRAHEAEREHNFTMLQAFEWETPAGKWQIFSLCVYTCGTDACEIGGKHWKWFEDKSDELGDMGITASLSTAYICPPCC